jgi:hypothetical protein
MWSSSWKKNKYKMWRLNYWHNKISMKNVLLIFIWSKSEISTFGLHRTFGDCQNLIPEQQKYLKFLHTLYPVAIMSLIGHYRLWIKKKILWWKNTTSVYPFTEWMEIIDILIHIISFLAAVSIPTSWTSNENS